MPDITDAPDVAAIAAKAVPPTIVAAANAIGMTVPDIINYLTVIWLLCLVAGQFWKAGVKIHGWIQRRKETA